MWSCDLFERKRLVQGEWCQGRAAADQSIPETAAEFAQGHWLFLQVQVLLSLIPAWCEGGCRDCLCENQCTWHSCYRGYLFSSLEDVVRVTTMSQDPKQLEEVSQGIWGVLGLSAGAPGCQEDTLHFQTNTHFSHSGLNIFCQYDRCLPNEQLRYSGHCFPQSFSMSKHLNQDKVWKCTCVLLLGGNCILVKCQTLCITLSKSAL